MIWKISLIWDIGGVLCDVATSIYNIKVLGEVESNVFARNYVMTPWWIVVEGFWLVLNWLLPYLVTRKYPIMGPLVLCPMAYGLQRWKAGVSNLRR